jgi:hypothetical protein
MNGKTYPYLDLVAIAPVGAALLDPRPALVFAGDGARILWANAAGVALFDARHMADLLDRRLSGLNPLKAQIARLARLLPSDSTRLEMLRIGQGVTFTALAAACRRLNLSDRTSAVFAVAAAGTGTESLVTRAERLADTIAEDDCLAAVVTHEGKVLGASGGYDALAPAEAAIDALVAMAASARRSSSRPSPSAATSGRRAWRASARATGIASSSSSVRPRPLRQPNRWLRRNHRSWPSPPRQNRSGSRSRRCRRRCRWRHPAGPQWSACCASLSPSTRPPLPRRGTPRHRSGSGAIIGDREAVAESSARSDDAWRGASCGA